MRHFKSDDDDQDTPVEKEKISRRRQKWNDDTKDFGSDKKKKSGKRFHRKKTYRDMFWENDN